MLKVHLKEVLGQYGYSLYDLSDAILDLEGISESTVYRFGRGGQNLTLNKLELILEAVRLLTGQPIRLSDLISDEEMTPPSCESGHIPSNTLVLLSTQTPEHDIDEVWELVAKRVSQRAPGRGIWWLAFGVAGLTIVGLILLGSPDWNIPVGLTVDAARLKDARASAALASSHIGASPATHMELKEMNVEGHAVGKPVCKAYKTPANTKPVVNECPDGKYKEQLFDEDWLLIHQRNVVVGQLNNPSARSLLVSE